MSLPSQPTPFDLHCAQAVADHQTLRTKQLQKARDASKRETTNQPVVASKMVQPDRISGMSRRDEDESYNTTLMEIEPIPERPALRVLNLLSRMGPPARSTDTQPRTPKDTVRAHSWSEKGVPKPHKKLAAVHSRKANYGGYGACEEGCYYEHICEKCFESYGSRYAHPYIRCGKVVRVGENDEEVVARGAQERRAAWEDSPTYPGGVRKTPGQGQPPERWNNKSISKEPLDFDMPPSSIDTVPYDSDQEMDI